MDDYRLFIPILLSTGRNERQTEKVAQYTLERAQNYGFKTQIVDVRDHMLDRTVPNWQDPRPSKKWSDVMNQADGLILVIPEYNHSFPGEFKLVYDQLFDEYKKKPVSICSVSTGVFGGARMIEHVWSVTLAAQMVPTSFAVHFSNIKSLFDEKGDFADPQKKSEIDGRMQKMLTETEWYAKTLKYGRRNFAD